VAESLRGLGADVDVREIRVRREYSKPLHLNPRLIFDTFLGRADIIVDFLPCADLGWSTCCTGGRVPQDALGQV